MRVLVVLIFIFSFIVTTVLYVNGIKNMKKNHPDYKTKNFLEYEENE